MDPQLFGLVEPIVILTFLSILTYGAKRMIWGKGPLRGSRNAEELGGLERRIAELEDLVEHQRADLLDRQADVEERLDFAERILTQHRAKELESPAEDEASTPV